MHAALTEKQPRTMRLSAIYLLENKLTMSAPAVALHI